MLARPGRTASQQRGVALITVLLIVALLTAVATRLSFSNHVWLKQVENGAALIQSGQASRAVQDWAGLILLKDDNNYDGHKDLWARPLPPLPVGPGSVQGHMEDMQGRFNLNNLRAGKDAPAQFKRLLRALGLNPGIADAVADWVDDDSNPTGVWGAEDGYYLGMNPPYLAANRPFKDTGELRLIRGVDRAAWHALKRHVAALPGPLTKVNVNTATPEVLAAMVPEWGTPQEALSEAGRWSKQTNQTPFSRIGKFYEKVGLGDENQLTGLTVNSKYFLAHTQVEVGHIRHRLATLYIRDKARATVHSHKREFE